MDGIGYTRRNPQNNLLNLFAQNALAGFGSAVGQHAGHGLGALAGLGFEKLGKATGLLGPSKELIDILSAQGMNENQARAFSELDPRAQQQLLQNLGAAKQAEQQRQALGNIEQLSQKPSAQQAISEQDQEKIAKKPATFFQDEEMPSSQEMYLTLKKAGVDDKTAKDFMKEYNADRKEFLKEKREDIKESKEYAKTIDKDASTAKDSNKRILRQFEILKEGKLPGAVTGTLSEMLGKVGLSLPALINGDAEEFKKLSAEYGKLITNYFPGRVTNIMIEQFMQTVPTLLQSDEGRLRVMNNLYNLNEAALIHEAVKKEIIKENGGKIPRHLQEEIMERAEEQLESLAERTIKGESSIPGFEQAMKSAEKRVSKQRGAAIAGGLLGAIPGVLAAGSGAQAGAALGSIGGPMSALGGAALGGLAPLALSGLLGSALGERLAGFGNPDYERDINNLRNLASSKKQTTKQKQQELDKYLASQYRHFTHGEPSTLSGLLGTLGKIRSRFRNADSKRKQEELDKYLASQYRHFTR